MMVQYKAARIVILIGLFGIISSCAPNCPPPKVVTQVVKEPVAVRCIDPAILPAEPPTITLPIDARLAADLAASQAKDLRKWGRSLIAIIGPCAQ